MYYVLYHGNPRGRRPTGNGGLGGMQPPQQGGCGPTGNGGFGGGAAPQQRANTGWTELSSAQLGWLGRI